MSENHVTFRIPKKALACVVALLIPGAFATGIALGRGGSDSANQTSTSSTSVAPTTTTTSAPTTTTPVVAQKQVTSTTIKKKKKVAATTTTTVAPKPAVTASYSDDCPAPGIANVKAGTMVVKWTTQGVVRVDVEVTHGAIKIYSKFNTTLNGEASINSICNNVQTADHKFTGQPLTVTYKVTGYTSENTPVGFIGEDKM